MATAFKHLRKRQGTVEVAGTGLRVLDVVDWCAGGQTPEAFAHDFGVPLEGVREALAYANSHGAEIEAERAANDELYRAVARDRGLS